MLNELPKDVCTRHTPGFTGSKSDSTTPSYLEEVLKLWFVVDARLEQRGSIDLTGTEVDVGLHEGQLPGQDIANQLHVIPARLLTSL